MKSLIVFGIINLCMGSLALAQTPASEVREILISDRTVQLNLQLNDQTVRCLKGDYSAVSLKISVPELKKHTVFSQTTAGEVEPCINAGSCRQFIGTKRERSGLEPGQIIDPNKPEELVDVNIKLSKSLYIDHVAKSCTITLREDITAQVRGLEFFHSDGDYMGRSERYDVCVRN